MTLKAVAAASQELSEHQSSKSQKEPDNDVSVQTDSHDLGEDQRLQAESLPS
jgi:hypothetical protein